MAEAAGLAPLMTPAVVLLGATVAAVPLFRRLGLGSVLGYFAAGLAVGPFGFGLFNDPASILHVSEIGVVFFLFIIGLEMRPARLWSMRRQIFGTGLGQVGLCVALLTAAGMGFGFAAPVAFVAGAGFVLSSTAVVMSVLQDRGEIATPEGQRAVSILLLEDLMIVPLLAIVAMLAPTASESQGTPIIAALVAVAILLAAGRWVMEPLFNRLARFGGREVMSAGALLVVLAAALLMEEAGLSTAMGAFMAGVLLSGSSYRHQIETDIEPFRGMLMGLFFLAVGMSLDLAVVGARWGLALGLLVAFMAVKGIGVFIVARLSGRDRRTSLQRMALFAQGGEFAFVLYAAARGAGVFAADQEALFGAVVILSMALTPLVLLAVARLLPPAPVDMTGVTEARDLHGRALVIGFGRFGQVASQPLMARGMAVSIIDTDAEMIRAAESLGFRVYYGDGTRLDILQTSGAGEAEVILVCLDKEAATDQVVAMARHHFPQAQLLVRAFDRRHSLALREAGVAYEIRETVESAQAMGRQALIETGTDSAEADAIMADLRRRDRERLVAQAAEGMLGGRDLLHVNIKDSFKQGAD